MSYAIAITKSYFNNDKYNKNECNNKDYVNSVIFVNSSKPRHIILSDNKYNNKLSDYIRSNVKVRVNNNTQRY